MPWPLGPQVLWPLATSATPPLARVHAQLHLTLCDPLDCSHQVPLSMGILQATILEWIAMPSSRGSSWPRDQTHIAYVSCTGRQVLYHQHPWEAATLPPLTLQYSSCCTDLSGPLTEQACPISGSLQLAVPFPSGIPRLALSHWQVPERPSQLTLV